MNSYVKELQRLNPDWDYLDYIERARDLLREGAVGMAYLVLDGIVEGAK